MGVRRSWEIPAISSRWSLHASPHCPSASISAWIIAFAVEATAAIEPEGLVSIVRSRSPSPTARRPSFSASRSRVASAGSRYSPPRTA